MSFLAPPKPSKRRRSEKFPSAYLLAGLLRSILKEKKAAYGDEELERWNIAVRPSNQDAESSLPGFLPSPRDEETISHQLKAAKDSLPSYSPNDVFLSPPPSEYASCGMASRFEATAGLLHERDRDRPAYRSVPDADGSASGTVKFVLPRRMSDRSAFEAVLYAGQDMGFLDDECAQLHLRPMLWRGMEALGEDEFLGCILSDASNQYPWIDNYRTLPMLRSELICVLALLLRQLLYRARRGDSDAYAQPVVVRTLQCVRVFIS